jgi:hypothetical protein
VNACLFNVLHHPAKEEFRAIKERVNIDFNRRI